MKYYLLVFFLSIPAVLPAQFLLKDASRDANFFSNYSGVFDGGPGVVVFDLNGDGWDDIFCPGGQDPSKIFLNMKDGTFKDITPNNVAIDSVNPEGPYKIYPRGGIAFDYNNDGFTDIYMTCERRDILWRNNGDGTFTDVTRYPAYLNIPIDENQSMTATFGDFDGDGWNDFYVARWIQEQNFSHDPNTGQIDGYAHRGFHNYFYVNNHNGSFADRATQYGIDGDTGCTNIALFFDYDRDGDLDLLIGNDFGVQEMPNRVWKNMLVETGKATFVEVTDSIHMGIREFNMGIGPCDFNRDGHFDFYETTFGPDSLMMNDGHNKFTPVQKQFLPPGDGYERSGSGIMGTSWSAVSGDFDNDGWDDEFIVHGYESVFSDWHTNDETGRDTSIFYRNVDGKFYDYTDMALNGDYIDLKARGGAYIDYNNDGKLDLVLGSMAHPTDTNSNFRLLENITPHHTEVPAHWLEMRFTAKRTAKEAVGTIVDVWTKGIIHSRQVSTGGGFGSQNSLMQHIGLGPYSYADSIIVFWPCDKNLHRQIDKYYNVKADTILHYTEQLSDGISSAPLQQSREVDVYPVPASSELKISNLLPSSTKHFEIFDLLGNKEIDLTGTETTFSISVMNLKPGCYVLRIIENGTIITKRFIKN